MWQPPLPGMPEEREIPPGRLGDIYRALPPEERTPYLDALYDRSVPAERLVAALLRFDLKVSASLIRTFRRTSSR